MLLTLALQWRLAAREEAAMQSSQPKITDRPRARPKKSWPHFRPSAVDFCGSRLAIGAATERARALAMPAEGAPKPYKRDSSGVAPASPQVADRALLERAGSREPADRGGVDGIGPRHIGLRLAFSRGRRATCTKVNYIFDVDLRSFLDPA